MDIDLQIDQFYFKEMPIPAKIFDILAGIGIYSGPNLDINMNNYVFLLKKYANSGRNIDQYQTKF